jgi:hypothetical protein
MRPPAAFPFVPPAASFFIPPARSLSPCAEFAGESSQEPERAYLTEGDREVFGRTGKLGDAGRSSA